MCDVHIGLIGKRVGDFLLVLIELFSLGRTAETIRAIIGSRSAISLHRGRVEPKFQLEGVAANQPFFFSSLKTRLNGLSQGIKFWTDFSSVLSQSTRLIDVRTDRHTGRQTDRRTEFSSLDGVCIPCSAVKTELIFMNNFFITECIFWQGSPREILDLRFTQCLVYIYDQIWGISLETLIGCS